MSRRTRTVLPEPEPAKITVWRRRSSSGKVTRRPVPSAMPMRMESSSASLDAAAAGDGAAVLGRCSGPGQCRDPGQCRGSGRSRRPSGTGGLGRQRCEQCRSARGTIRSEPRGDPLRLLFEELLQGPEHLEVSLQQLHDGAAVRLEPIEYLPGLPALRPRCVAQDEQPPPLPRELEPGRRHGGPQPVQRGNRVVVQDGSKRPMHFIIGVRIDYAPQPGMQRRVPPERRIHREVTRPAVFLRPGSQAGAQQRGQITVHLLLVEGVGRRPGRSFPELADRLLVEFGLSSAAGIGGGVADSLSLLVRSWTTGSRPSRSFVTCFDAVA